MGRVAAIRPAWPMATARDSQSWHATAVPHHNQAVIQSTTHRIKASAACRHCEPAFVVYRRCRPVEPAEPALSGGGAVGWACLSGAQRSEFAQPPRLTRLVKGSLAAQAARPGDRAGSAYTRRTPAPKELSTMSRSEASTVSRFQTEV